MEKKIVQLQLKPAKRYYENLPTALKKDVQKIKDILNNHGYDATNEIIAMVWNTASEDYMCAGWMCLPNHLPLDQKEKTILKYILEYTEPVSNE